jgi:hypothetical protein
MVLIRHAWFIKEGIDISVVFLQALGLHLRSRRLVERNRGLPSDTDELDWLRRYFLELLHDFSTCSIPGRRACKNADGVRKAADGLGQKGLLGGGKPGEKHYFY